MNLNKKLVVGIDIGGTNTEIGIVNEGGDILFKETISSRCTENFEEFIHILADKILEIIDNLGFKGMVNGIGLGAPNGNYYTGTVEFAPNLIWKGVLPFVAALKKASSLNVVMTNDANAAAFGEGVYGGAKGMKHYVVITLGTGLGSGIVCDGKLLYGHDGFAGELGHVIVQEEGGRKCGCGRYGCLETYVSAPGIVKTAIEFLNNLQDDSVLRNVSPTKMTSLDIAEAAQNNDKIAQMCFDFTAKKLAIALANLAAITSPEAIFLSGGLANSGNILFKPLINYYNQYVLAIFKGKTQILASQLKDNSTGLLGAAALAQYEL